MKKLVILLAVFFLPFVLFPFFTVAQGIKDTVITLKEIPIHVYPSNPLFFYIPAAVSILNKQQLQEQPVHSLVFAMNTLSGVRMEERSPGSYRLSIRGSLLRSPFGVRNVKIYIDEFPFTDAGGNTYLNLLDPSCIKNMEILKGPEGSLFGANTGGVALIDLYGRTTDTSHVSMGISAGSYGLLRGNVSWNKNWGKYRLEIGEAYQQLEGYRTNSALQRNYSHILQQWEYKPHRKIKLLMLYSDLRYRTPGGLTQQQALLDPTSARPATKFLPGALEQKAGISNKTFFGGFLHEAHLGSRVRSALSVSGMHTNFENPFITNYEVRRENSMNLRAFCELSAKAAARVPWKWILGTEGQHSDSQIRNYGNRSGIRDTLQVSDKLRVLNYFYFSQLSADLTPRWICEASLSVNHYAFRYKNEFSDSLIDFTTKKLEAQLMPRLAILYKIIRQNLVWRASLSRGYSPPTLAEIRPSGNTIDIKLQPEIGLNYETGFRLRDNEEKIRVDISAFYFQLQDAIVRRTDIAGTEYFMNAGGVEQPGMEIQFISSILSLRNKGFIRELSLRSSLTHYQFLFTNYQVNNTDYTGNELTGVPRSTLVSGITIQFPLHLNLMLQHNYTDRIPLDDGNTAYADSYNLIQAKAGWKFKSTKKWGLEVVAGADNLLDEFYSLGNDLNAFGGRYYNPAPGRNFYTSVSLFF